MINTDLQVLHAIQAGPSGADVKALARIVESLMAKAIKLDNTVETLIEESAPERLPVDGQDWLKPAGWADDEPSSMVVGSSLKVVR